MPQLSVTVVTKMPSPYQVELFDEITRQNKCSLRVVYLGFNDGLHPWPAPRLHHDHCFLTHSPRDWSTAWDWCMESDLTVFNFYTHVFPMAAIYARSASGRPWVFWGERPGYLQLGAFAKMVRRFFLKPLRARSVSIWGVGKFALEGYLAEWGKAKRYFNLPYYSELSRFRRREHVDHEERVILYSGLLNKRKDVMSLARAFLLLASEQPRARLWILGSGPLEGEMRNVLRPVQDKVRWLGFLPWDELPGVYQQADLFCLPSLHDGWGMVVVEALAAGLPVVTTNTTGAAMEFVKEGENGWLIPPGDQSRLLEVLREAVTAPASRIFSMREAAKASVKDHSLEQGAEKFVQITMDSIAATGSALAPPIDARRSSDTSDTHVLLVGNYLPDGQPSMQRYAQLVTRCLDENEIPNTLVRPNMVFRRPWLPPSLARFAGYIDKFVIFPFILRWKATRTAPGKKLLIHLLDQGNALYLTWIRDFYVIATCHDLIAVRAALGDIDEAKRPSHGPWIQRAILQTLARARTILCVSKSTLQDCLRLLPDPKPSLEWLPNPLAPGFDPADEETVTINLPDKFLLHVGNSSWYKNRIGVLRIYGELSRIDPEVMPLVLMGAPLLKAEEVLIQELGIAAKCFSIGNPSDEWIKSGYRNAEALIFPSLIEGFGWPILEAMACGCPVFTSNRSPMTEVGGTAAEYLDPEDEKSAAALIANRLSQGSAWRNTRVDAGREHVKSFSYESFAKDLLRIYDDALAEIDPQPGVSLIA